MSPLRVIFFGDVENCLKELHHDLKRLNIRVLGAFADLDAAGESLGNLQRANRQLFIIQYSEKNDIKTIERLNNSFAGWPILVIVPHDANAQMLMQITRAGASQIITLPLVSEDFQKALIQIARQFGFELSSTQIIAVCGAMEGAGTTSLAITLCAELIQLYQTSVILIDFARQIGQVASYLNLEPQYTTKHLFNEPDRIDSTLVKQTLTPVEGEPNWKVIAAPFHLHPPLVIRAKDAHRVLALTRELVPFVVIDLPFLFDDAFFHTLATADQIVLVGQPILPSVKVMRMLAQHLKTGRFPRQQYYVLNRFNSKTSVFSTDRLREAVGVDTLHIISDEPVIFTQAVNLGSPLYKINKNSLARKSIQDLTRLLVKNEPVTPTKKTSSVWQRLVGSK